MIQDFWMDSLGKGTLRCRKWLPQGQPKAVVQIIHGIAELIDRYDAFASFLNHHGIAVVAEDHMGHGGSMEGGSTRGYFHGGWFTAVADTHALMQRTMAEYPHVPYVLFGHSMGSFMARTILAKYPQSGIRAAVICGTGWQPRPALPAMIRLVELICRKNGEQAPSEALQKLVFGGYNKKVEHPRTKSDWLTRDSAVVDAYEAHPLCGFTPSAGLIRDMLQGLRYIEQPENLGRMEKTLPVFFIAGGDDPVGNYGKCVEQAAKAFRKAGMEQVCLRLYPLCRHEILNEINKEEVYQDVLEFINKSVLLD